MKKVLLFVLTAVLMTTAVLGLFTVTSFAATPKISLNKTAYKPDEDIEVTVQGSEAAKDWIGCYKKADIDIVDGEITTTITSALTMGLWAYAATNTHTAGSDVAADGTKISINLTTASSDKQSWPLEEGDYVMIFFSDDGYNVLSFQEFSVSNNPSETTPTAEPTSAPTATETPAPTATATEAATQTKTSSPTATKGTDGGNDNNNTMWIVIIAVAVVLIAGAAVIIVLYNKKKKG